MHKILNRLAYVLIGAALLLIQPLANGRPSLFPDTKAYIVLGEQIAEKIGLAKRGQSIADLAGGPHAGAPAEESLKERTSLALTVAGARSPFYSFYLFTLAHFGTFWLVAVVQACVASWLIFVFSHAVSPNGGIKLYFTNIGVAAFLTTLPLYAGFMMPDITAGLGVLAATSLMLFPERISHANKLALVALTLFSLLSHSTHQFLVLSVACAGFFGLRFAGVPAKIAVARAMILIALFFLSVLGSLAYRASARLFFHDEARKPPFLMARILEDGPGRDYLRSACSADPNAFELCRFEGRPLDDSTAFLWLKRPDTGVFGPADYRTRVRLIEEQWRFVWGAFRFAPAAQMTASVRNFAHQLERFRVDDVTNGGAVIADPEFMALSRMLPGSEICWTQPGRCASALPDEWLGWINEAVFVFSLALSFAVIGLSLKRNETSARRACALLGIMLSTLIINAAVCGILSGPFARYQTRITWLFPVTLIAIWALCRYETPVSIANNGIPPLGCGAREGLLGKHNQS